MKLRNHLMFWLTLTSILPLLVLLLVGNRYNQRVLLESVDQDMLTELNRLASSLDQQLRRPQDLLETLAESPIVHEFGEALSEVVEQGGVSWRYSQSRWQVEGLLRDIQPLVAEDAELRILDRFGNTVIKASFGAHRQPDLDSLLPYPISEAEPDARLAQWLDHHASGEIQSLYLPHFATSEAVSPLLSYIKPVQLSHQRLYITFSHTGERLDQVVNLAPRLRGARLSILEAEPQPAGQPRLLFDDATGTHFLSRHPAVSASLGSQLLASWSHQPEGVFETRDEAQRVYFSEYQPYPDSFVTWLLVASVDKEVLTQQFRVTRWGLSGLVVLMLILGLLLSTVASRRLSRPIIRLAENLRHYAEGKPTQPDIPTLSSEVKGLQDAFNKMTDTLEQAQKQQALAEKRLQASAKLASIGEMAAGIGHELNNPLNNILSLSKLLKQEANGYPQLVEDADSLREEALRASRIVRGVLNFARQIEPDYQRFNVSKWVKCCVGRVREIADACSVEITVNCTMERELEADPFQLEQVMVNVLRNAIQSSPAGGQVEVNVSADESQLWIKVIDHGEGLSASAEQRIFEPFFTTREVGEGSGLGLSVSLGIMKTHAGDLQLVNHIAGGCIATISLPWQRRQ